MGRKPAYVPEQILLFDNSLLITPAEVDEKTAAPAKLAQEPPQPASNQAPAVGKTGPTFKQLSRAGYSLDEVKVLMAGFSLVKYIREEKKVLRTCLDPLLGWYLFGIFPTFAKAEQVLKEQLTIDDSIEALEDGTVTMRGKNSSRLYAAGFDFYRSEGIMLGRGTPRIKQGSKNWGTWKKYESAKACEKGWKELMKEMKSLQG